MRVLIIILTLTIIYGSSSAQTLYPFQVLYAENARLRDGRELKSLDMVSVDESIKIENGGSLVLIHDTGFPIEINGDTIVALNQLDEILAPKKSKKQKKKTSVTALTGIGIDFLFITDLVKANKTKLNRTGMYTNCTISSEFYFPPQIEARKFYFDNSCYKWVPFGSGKYTVEIRSMSNDFIKSYHLDQNELDLRSVPNQEFTQNTYVIEVKDSSNNKLMTDRYLLKRFDFKGLSNPFPCELAKASSALIVGYLYETSRMNLSEMAEEYYILATKLSSKKFYQDMLANYYSRQAK